MVVHLLLRRHYFARFYQIVSMDAPVCMDADCLLQSPMAASGRIGSCHGALRVFGHFSESDYVNQVSFDESSVSSLDIAEISARKPSCAAPSKAAIGPDGSEASSPAGAFSADVSPAASVVSKLAFAAFMGNTLPSGFSSMAERT